MNLEEKKIIVNQVIKEIEGKKIIKSSYRATEKLLYSYPKLPESISFMKKEISRLKKELSLMPKKGTSKTIVINEQKNNYFYGDDTLEIRLSELKQVVAKVESQIRLIKNALSKISNDEYYEIITKYYFDRCTLEELAEYFDTSNVTIIKHKKALINELKVYLFPSEFISEL